MTAFSEFLEPKTAAPGRTGTAAAATDCEESKAMTTISGSREEVSIYGTGIAHIPLVGHPEFAGLTRDDSGQPTACVKDGALQIETDDVNLLLAWRDVFQLAATQMVIWRERGGVPSLPEQLDERQSTIVGLAALLDFLKKNPDVPVNPCQAIHYSAAKDASGIAEVDRIGAMLSPRPGRGHPEGPHHMAVRAFGPVEYRAAACNVYPAEQDSEATS